MKIITNLNLLNTVDYQKILNFQELHKFEIRIKTILILLTAQLHNTLTSDSD